jgi:hypothetical protein
MPIFAAINIQILISSKPIKIPNSIHFNSYWESKYKTIYCEFLDQQESRLWLSDEENMGKRIKNEGFLNNKSPNKTSEWENWRMSEEFVFKYVNEDEIPKDTTDTKIIKFGPYDENSYHQNISYSLINDAGEIKINNDGYSTYDSCFEFTSENNSDMWYENQDQLIDELNKLNIAPSGFKVSGPLEFDSLNNDQCDHKECSKPLIKIKINDIVMKDLEIKNELGELVGFDRIR